MSDTTRLSARLLRNRSLMLMAGVLGAGQVIAGQTYCVSNSPSTHGLYTNEVYYSSQCADPNDKNCISREHFFSWVTDAGTGTAAPVTPAELRACTTKLVVDGDAATLTGVVDGNKNTMEVDVDLALSGGLTGGCGTTGRPFYWPGGGWGKATTNANKALIASWSCYSAIDGQFGDGVPGTNGGYLQGMYQPVDAPLPSPVTATILQIGVGADGVVKSALGGFATFPVVVDGVASSKTWELGMRLTPVPNELPVAVDDGPVDIGEEDDPTPILVLGNDTDADGDALTITAVSALLTGQGSVAISADSLSVVYTPEPERNFFSPPTVTFTYTVSDGKGGTDTATVTINVTPVNDEPIAVDDPDEGKTIRVTMDKAKTICASALLVNDTDVDDVNADLRIAEVSAASSAGGSAVLATSALCSAHGGQAVVFTPETGYEGVDTFTYRASDGEASSANAATVTVTVVGPFEIVKCPTGTEDDGDGDPNTIDRADCLIDWVGDESLLTRFDNEPDVNGTIELDGLHEIEDPRAHCGGTPPADPNAMVPGPDGTMLQQKWGAASGLPASATLPGLAITPPVEAASGTVLIPWYVCGMPSRPDPKLVPCTGASCTTFKPVFTLVNAKSDFLAETGESFRDIVNSVVQHEADPYDVGNYQCIGPNTTNVDPLLAWLPRNDEIPYVVGNGTPLDPGTYPGSKARQVRDITNGCAGARGGTSTRSYLVKDLIYFDGTANPATYGTGVTGVGNAQLKAVIRAEIDDLEQTLLQPGRAWAEGPNADSVADDTRMSCVDADQNVISNIWPQPEKLTGGSLLIEKVRVAFDASDYVTVNKLLDQLLLELGPTRKGNKGAGLWSAFDTCYYKRVNVGGAVVDRIYNLPYAVLDGCTTTEVSPGEFVQTCPNYPPAGSGYIPRNFRGDLEAQLLHIKFNLNHRLRGIAQSQIDTLLPTPP